MEPPGRENVRSVCFLSRRHAQPAAVARTTTAELASVLYRFVCTHVTHVATSGRPNCLTKRGPGEFQGLRSSLRSIHSLT
jgi:hypothetical protein